MKILMTGATGFIGKRLARRLSRENHELVVLSRDARSAARRLEIPCRILECDLLQRPPAPEAFAGVQAIVHLAGEPVAAGRWTPERKEAIRDSRLIGTRNLVEGMRASGNSPVPSVFVATSAIGFYGERGEESLTEGSAPGQGFLAEVCQGWEDQARGAEAPGTRVAMLRLGIVLGQGGGAIEKMLRPFSLGLGAKLGSGQQWMSWVHIDDVVRAFILALMDSRVAGPVNVVAPEPVRNEEFTRILAQTLGKKARLSIPAPLLRVGLGEMAGALFGSARALPRKLESLDFSFAYPTLHAALSRICRDSYTQPMDPSSKIDLQS